MVMCKILRHMITRLSPCPPCTISVTTPQTPCEAALTPVPHARDDDVRPRGNPHQWLSGRRRLREAWCRNTRRSEGVHPIALPSAMTARLSAHLVDGWNVTAVTNRRQVAPSVPHTPSLTPPTLLPHKPAHPGPPNTRSPPHAGATPLREGSRSGAFVVVPSPKAAPGPRDTMERRSQVRV